jgi:uncharacterized protein
MFANPPAEAVARLLREAHIIAVVGLAESILGEPAVASLDQPREVLDRDERVDIVDVFRRPQHVPRIVDDCIRLELPGLWLQEGVVDEAAAVRES